MSTIGVQKKLSQHEHKINEAMPASYFTQRSMNCVLRRTTTRDTFTQSTNLEIVSFGRPEREGRTPV